MDYFNDTKTAFIAKNNHALNKAWFMFKMISFPFLSRAGSALVKFALKIHFPISWIIKPTVYSHFCGGESIEECKSVVENIQAYNVKSILDYSVEGKEDEKDIEAALAETLRTIENAGKNPNIPFAVFKPTAFTQSRILEKHSAGLELNHEEKIAFNTFGERIEKLCQAASNHDIPILIDAEDSWYQRSIDLTVEKMMEKYNKEKAIVFNTLQMYRHDRIDFLRESYKKAKEKNYYLGIKFVRGAYMEKERERAKMLNYPDPIQKNKEHTDRDYNEALRFCMEHLDRISIFNGTHNEYSSYLLKELMDEKGIKADDPRIYFSQLYGMSDHISFKLAKEGYNVAKYLPYGPVKHVMPYLLRRIEENTSIAGQTSRELKLIIQEKKRRKQEKSL